MIAEDFFQKWSPLGSRTLAGWIPACAGMTEGEVGVIDKDRFAEAIIKLLPVLSRSCNHSLMRKGYVYILASKRNGTLYIGMTADLPGRLYEHQNELTPGFTSRYGVKTLVWFEEHYLITDAIRREKMIKKWSRAWKLRIIEEMNPAWDDISRYLLGL